MKVQCCVCNKVRDQDQWLPPQPETAPAESVSHGYCPQCLEQAHREIRALRYGLPANAKLVANH
ncbi:MAG: hypothetical protein RLZZ303_3136 [Candidatus Hydrogenedentota bacterium]|jgi:hypothetical protein